MHLHCCWLQPSGERACNSAYACRDLPAKCWWLLKIEPNVWAGGNGSCSVCVDLQAVGALEFFGELYSLAKGFGPFLRGFGQALEKGRVLFLVTTSTSPSLQAYAELHALSPLRGSISPCYSTAMPLRRANPETQMFTTDTKTGTARILASSCFSFRSWLPYWCTASQVVAESLSRCEPLS